MKKVIAGEECDKCTGVAVIATKENDNIAQLRICAYSPAPLSTLLHQEDAERVVFSQ